MHSAHWEELMYKVTHDLNIAGSDIWVDTSYDMLHQVGVEITLCFVDRIEWKPNCLELQLESSKLMEWQPKMLM